LVPLALLSSSYDIATPGERVFASVKVDDILYAMKFGRLIPETMEA
jgi:hypothetical protein